MKPWEITDKTMSVVVKHINAEFHNARRLLKTDELNVISTKAQSEELYARLMQINEAAYRKIAVDIYRKSYLEATGEKDNRPDHLIWLAIGVILAERYDPVSKYVYANEARRKRERFTEAVMSAPSFRDGEKSIATARNLWLRQTLHYGDVITLEAMKEALAEGGVTHLMWNTQKDAKVCKTCRPLDGKIFPIEEYPPPQHYHCRCYPTIAGVAR